MGIVKDCIAFRREEEVPCLRALCVCGSEAPQQLPRTGIEMGAIVRSLYSWVALAPERFKVSDARGVQLILQQI